MIGIDTKHKYKTQVDKASGNWEILRERNEFNGLHSLKMS